MYNFEIEGSKIPCFRITCPHCNKYEDTEEINVGFDKVKCLKCGHKFVVEKENVERIY